MTRPLNSEVLEYLDRYGEKASKVLSKLGQLDANLYSNLDTAVGREILKEDVERLDILFELIYNQKAKKEDYAEFKYLKTRIDNLSRKLSLYNEGLKKISEAVNKQ